MHTPADRVTIDRSLRLRGAQVVRVESGDVLRDQVVDIVDGVIAAITPAADGTDASDPGAAPARPPRSTSVAATCSLG
jgi:hypothetical protein